MSGLAVVVALAAAIAFGWSTALMHHGASGADDGVGYVALLRHVVGQWRWLLGMVASLLGLGLHVVALHLGSLSLVQPVVVTGLFFSLVFRDALDRQRPSRRTLTWGAVTAAGLALFLTAAGSTDGVPAPDDAHAALLIGAGLVVAAALVWTSSRRSGAGGLLMGTAAGIVFGLVAGAIKAATQAWGAGEVLSSWPAYAVCVLGPLGFLLNQRAYNRTRLPDYLPMLNMVNPLVSLAFGVVVYSERPAGDAVSVAAEAAGLGAVLLGIFFLARTDVPAAAPARGADHRADRSLR
jgi:drug/metabolite transporter (DMT)-like permease